MDRAIPDGLELVTDLNIIKLFPTMDSVPERQVSFSFMRTDNLSPKTLRPTYIENKGILTRLHRKARQKVFSDDGTVNPQPHCKWGISRLSRFISRYVYFYRQKPSDNRTFILDQILSVAKEYNVKLPTPSEMNTRRPRKHLVVDSINENSRSAVTNMKVYFDGENLVGYVPQENNFGSYERRARTQWDDVFDTVYTMLKSLPENSEMNKTVEEKQQIRSGIEAELIRQFYDVYDYSDITEDEPCPLFISRKLWNLSASYKERKKRFFRKKDQIRWTAWITITYDDSKFTSEDDFRRTLKTYFKNRSHPDRGNWRVMGKFEYGEEKGRLHFHGFFYIPEGTASRKLVNKSHYRDKDCMWHNYKADAEFLAKFGDNEYEDIEDAMHADINAMARYTDKMTQYMDKGEKVFYSRHIPTEFELQVMGKEIFTGFRIIHKREVKRYVLNDKAFIRSDTDIKRKTDVLTQELVDIGLVEDAA